jgi:hypothetical protein
VNKLLKDRLDGGRRGPVEINEAFAVVLPWRDDRAEIPRHRVNVTAVPALGHTIGAMCPHHRDVDLRAEGNEKKVSTPRIGGGEGTAMAIELL